LLRDETGADKGADLGLARFRDPGSGGETSLTQAGMVVGTVDYMSPEQAVDSGTVDHRTDIYSLGCTLYFLLTGHPPYEGGSIMSIMLKHRDAPIPDPRAERPDVPAELEAVYRRMVAKNPDDRHQSMTAVVAHLERTIERTKLVPNPSATHGNTVELGPDQLAAMRDDADFEIAPGAPPLAEPSPVVGLTAVLAEPSRTQIGIIKSYLQQLGITAVHTTGSGRQAIELVKQVRANFLMSALHLSDMTGAQLAAALRAEPDCAGVGFVLATSETDATLAGELPTGARATVMFKPFDLDRLARAIAAVSG
jgi:serine/threonine protein kinase